MARNWVDAAGEPAHRPVTRYGVEQVGEEPESAAEVVDDATDDLPDRGR